VGNVRSGGAFCASTVDNHPKTATIVPADLKATRKPFEIK
jgi:hypothetical protein